MSTELDLAALDEDLFFEDFLNDSVAVDQESNDGDDDDGFDQDNTVRAREVVSDEDFSEEDESGDHEDVALREELATWKIDHRTGEHRFQSMYIYLICVIDRKANTVYSQRTPKYCSRSVV
jgi:hypothetical protein